MLRQAHGNDIGGIIISADRKSELQAQIREHGYGYISKPVKPLLRALMNSILRPAKLDDDHETGIRPNFNRRPQPARSALSDTKSAFSSRLRLIFDKSGLLITARGLPSSLTPLIVRSRLFLSQIVVQKANRMKVRDAKLPV